MYQPYPASTGMPGSQRPPTPGSVRLAAVVMYAGAAASLIRVVADVLTRSQLRALLAARGRTAPLHPTASQVAGAANGALVVAAGVGVISIGLWIFLARAIGHGSNGARITGTVLFGLATLALLVGPSDLSLGSGQPVAARICTGIVWLAGLGAVILLWQRGSRNFFREPPL
jgi:hypothetical protein